MALTCALRAASLAALVQLLGCVAPAPPDPRLARAEAFERVGSWPEAAALWTDVYATSGGRDVRAGLGAAEAMLSAGAPADARAILLDLTVRAPREARAFELLGRAYEALGDPRSALNSYRESVALDAASARAQARFGDLSLEFGDTEAGLAALERGVALDPSAPRPRIRLGLRLLELGRTDRAISALDGVLAGPEGTDEERLAAAVRLGPHAASAAWLAPVVAARPDDAVARRMLGEALLAAGRVPAALRELEDAAASDPGDVDALIALASALRLAGDAARARSILGHASALVLSSDERSRVEALLEVDTDADVEPVGEAETAPQEGGG
ncbi:MAG: tetratricopeptide repeat protein [Planctomycetota bacterium]